MDDKYLNTNDGLIERYLYHDFLGSLLKQLSPQSIETLFKKVIYGEIRAIDILNMTRFDDKIEDLKKENNRLWNENINLKDIISERNEEISSLMNAVRHYEDFLIAYKMRREVVSAKRFGKLLEEDD